MKYLVTIYQETYTEYLVEAVSASNARDLAWEGEGEVQDVTVKESDIIECKEINS